MQHKQRETFKTREFFDRVLAGCAKEQRRYWYSIIGQKIGFAVEFVI